VGMTTSRESRARAERRAVAAAAHQALSDRNHVTTTEIARAAGVSVSKAYARMTEFEARGLVNGSLVAVKTIHGKELRERGGRSAVGAIAWQAATPHGYRDELARDASADSPNDTVPKERRRMPRRIIDPAKVQTRQVLAARYVGGRSSLGTTLSHSIEEGADKTLCRRIKEENLADEYAGDPSVPPTCPECLRRDPRFGSRGSNKLVPHRSAKADLPLDMDEYVPHGAGPLSSALLRTIRAGRPIARIVGYKVFAVDGAAVRNLVHIDFTTGGNPGRYSYVPEGEVWVERVLEPSDAAASLLHELVETILMQEGGLDYDAAHEEASGVETMLRAQMRWSPGDESTLSLSQAADVAADWLSRWLRVRRAG
jgi:hypothetical protein